MHYKENPFNILRLSMEANRDTIVQKADDMCFDAPENEEAIEQAKGILLNPQRRIRAELSWLPEVGTDIFEKICFTENDILGLNSLAAMNFRLAAMEMYSPHDLADAILKIDELYATISIDELWKLLNKERKRAGFPLIQEAAMLKAPWQERRGEIKHIIQSCVEKLPNDVYIQISGMIAEQAAAKGKFGSILQDYIDDYKLAQLQANVQLQDYFKNEAQHFQQGRANLTTQKAKITQAANLLKPLNLYAQTMGTGDLYTAGVLKYSAVVYNNSDEASAESNEELLRYIRSAFAYSNDVKEVLDKPLASIEQYNAAAKAEAEARAREEAEARAKAEAEAERARAEAKAKAKAARAREAAQAQSYNPPASSSSSSSSSSESSSSNDDGCLSCFGCLGLLVIAGAGGAFAGPPGVILAIVLLVWIFSEK